MANEEHVEGAQGASGETPTDDVSKQIEDLQAAVAALTQDITKRDALLAKTQSDKDKLTARLEKEQRQRERLEASRQRDVANLPANEQTDYLRRVAAEEHQKATKFELAHEYGLDPTELDGEFANAGEMRLRAIELSQAKGRATLDGKLEQLTEIVTQVVTAQQKMIEEPAPVRPDVGGRRASALPDPDTLAQFDDVARQAIQERDHKTAVAAVLAKIHRDPSKVLGSSTPSDELPPELQAKLRR